MSKLNCKNITPTNDSKRTNDTLVKYAVSLPELKLALRIDLLNYVYLNRIIFHSLSVKEPNFSHLSSANSIEQKRVFAFPT